MIHYLLVVSICWIALYAVYYLAMRRETFFSTNRAYLMASLVLGLLIPAYRWIPSEWYTQSADSTAYYIYDIVAVSTSAASDTAFSWMDLLPIIYWLGVAFMVLRLLYGLSRIAQLYRSGEKQQHGRLQVVYTDRPHLPFSFWQTIYISRQVPMQDEIDSILRHETVHVKAWHSIDILIIEVFHAFFWFNPILPFYKKAIRQAHEYVADAVVIQDIPRKSYGQLLLRQSQSGLEIALANHFFHSQIKKRITMMYQEKSKRPAMVKYLAAIPVLALLLLVFSSHATVDNYSPEPCEKPNFATIKYENGDVVAYKYCVGKDQQITYAEIIKEKTNVTDQASLKNRLKAFYTGDVPPPPPPAPELAHDFVPPPPPPPAAPTAPDWKSAQRHVHPVHKAKTYDIADGDKVFVKTETRILKEGKDYTLDRSTGKIKVNDSAGLSPDATVTVNILEDADQLTSVFKVVDEMPRFPGCEDLASDEEKDQCAKQKMLEYIYSNLRYPAAARKNGTQGMVVLQFIVGKDGKLHHSKIVRDVADGLGAEALRVVESMNNMDQRWIPGRQRGETVNVSYTLPVRYKLEDDTKPTEGKASDSKISIDGGLEGKPLIYVDGKLLKVGSVNDLDPNTIESVQVYKGEKAVEKFGPEGKNGVIDVKTKTSINIVAAKPAVEEEVFKIVEDMPRFPGCENVEDKEERQTCARQKMLNYIYQNVTYPEAAKNAGKGGVAVVGFIVDKSGELKDFKLMRDPGMGMGDEAMRVVESMNDMDQDWIPGKQRGKLVSVRYVLPIKYKLAEKDDSETRSSSKRGETLELSNYNLSPNPAKDNFRLAFETKAGPLQINMYNIEGKVLKSQNYENFNGRFDQTFQIDEMMNTAGTVYIQIRQGEQNTTRKLVIAQ